jgi:hypothetical protein
MNTSRPLIVVALALLGAGCGSAGPGPTTGQSAASDPGAAAYRYADCMRSHGVTSFPDPHVRQNGNEIQVVQGLPPSAAASPHFKSAQRACRGIIPAPGNGPQRDQPGHKAALLAFARCMRAHGVSAFPDPNPQGQITRAMLSASGIDLRSHPLLQAALGCVAVTHGAITASQVQSAVNGPH